MGPPSIFLIGELSFASEPVRLALLTLCRRPGPLQMIISSPGGDCDCARALIGSMRLRGDVAVRALGECSSSALLVLAAGRPGERTATPEVIAQPHPIQLAGKFSGDARLYCRIARNLAHDQQLWVALMAELTGQAERTWRRLMQREILLTAEDLLEYGVIDRIAKPGARPRRRSG